MQHTKNLIRPDGTKIQIDVSFWESLGRFKYDVRVSKCEKRKRTFYGVLNSNDYEYRKLSMEQREVYAMNKYLEFVTKEEIQQAKEDLWQLLKP